MNLLQTLKTLKPSLQKEGFIIDGIFGSYARGDFTENSDVDILYHLEPLFMEKYGGFIGFKKLNDIKVQISSLLKKDVDLAPINNLSETGKKYILSEIVYV
jgi:hypothetical protein